MNPLFLLGILPALAAVFAMEPSLAADAELAATLQQRLDGDRTGACMAVAVIDASGTRTAYACADPKRTVPDSSTAFEIGSVTKTMTAAIVAQLLASGDVTLDTPLAELLPKTKVPSRGGKKILLRHVLTHTSGLPAIPASLTRDANPLDPYAKLDAKTLLRDLAQTELQSTPGERFAYSNFAYMVLSAVLSERLGKPYDALVAERVFTPLGMTSSYVVDKPDPVRAAQGHMPTGTPTPAWTLDRSLAGVGGVRATLPDMARYVEAQLGRCEGGCDGGAKPAAADDAALRRALATTHAVLAKPQGGPSIGMAWMRLPVGERTFVAHEGGTGGFSSFVGFDLATKRGAVVLADTAMTSLGGVGSIGLHFIDASLPIGEPRRATKPDAKLLETLVGEWQLDFGLKMSVRTRREALFIQAEGQPEFEMGYDSAGDFYPLLFDAMLKPTENPDGSRGFVWSQMGGVSKARRIGD